MKGQVRIDGKILKEEVVVDNGVRQGCILWYVQSLCLPCSREMKSEIKGSMARRCKAILLPQD